MSLKRPRSDAELYSNSVGKEYRSNDEMIWILFQLSDSSFGGSLSHSMSLESAFQHHLISKSTESLRFYVMKLLEQVTSIR
jgi:urease accessory protein UreF